MKGKKQLRFGILGGVVAICVLALAPLASADPLTERQEYKEQAEPICKTNVLANKRIFKNVKQQVKDGELKKASKAFSRAVTAFDKTIRQLDAIAKPPTYEAKLTQWVGSLKGVNTLIGKIGQALGADKKNKAESYSVELDRKTQQANNTVLSFGFNYCRIESSRFG
jgi:hypothetical protein